MQDAKGNPGKRKAKAPKAILPLAVGNVSPPKWLKKSRAATEIWNQLAPLLEKLNALTQIDAFPLARYCRYSVQWVTASEAVEKEGSWFDAVGTNGEATKKRHPALQASLDLDKALREIEAAFGMRPDARFKMLRDQASLQGLGDLFKPRQDEAPQPASSPAAEEDDPIGFLATQATTPPGSRPN